MITCVNFKSDVEKDQNGYKVGLLNIDDNGYIYLTYGNDSVSMHLDDFKKLCRVVLDNEK